MPLRITFFLSLLVIVSLAASEPVSAAEREAQNRDWPHWRGPTRNDLSPEPSGWQARRWPVGKPDWSARVGLGCTTPIVAGKCLYTLGWAGNADTVFCLDARTGKVLWKVSYRCPRHGRHHLGDEGFYAGPSSTPEFDAETGYLYTLSIDGDLHCWNTRKKGRKVWHLNLYDRHGMPRRPKVTRVGGRRDYGYTTAPLVYGDWLLVEVGGKEGNLVAFDKGTGQQRWASACQDRAGHTGGLAPLTVEGIPCVAVLTLTHLRIYRLDKGKAGQTVASYPWTTSFANNIATPTVLGEEVLITSAYNRYAICKLRIRLGGATRVWEQPYPSKACSPVIHKGRVYLAWKKVRCLDWQTGKLLWEGGDFGDTGSCLMTADDRLIVLGNSGTLALVESAERAPHRYRELAATNRLFRTLVWPHVILAQGRIYCKDREGNLRCFVIE